MSSSHQPTVQRYRLILLVVHFALTYPRWSWGLFVFLASRSLPLERPAQGLMDPYRRMGIAVQEESETYQACTHDYFQTQVPEKRNETVYTEWQRIHQVQTENRLALHHWEESLTRCEASVDSAHSALRAWAQQTASSAEESIPLVPDTTQCSASDREDLSKLLWDLDAPSPDSLRRQIMAVWDDYQQQSLERTARLANYTSARTAYDYNYFVGLKIDENLDWLEEWKTPDLDLSAIFDIRSDLSNLLDTQVLTFLSDAMIRIVLLQDRMASFFLSLEDFDLHYRDLFDRLVSASVFIDDFLPLGIPLPASLDLRGVPIADQLLPEIFQIPYFDTDLPRLDAVSHRFLALVDTILEELKDRLDEGVLKALQQLKQDIQDKFSLEDYNPPRFGQEQDITESLNTELEKGQTMALETREVLDDSLRDGLITEVNTEFDVQMPTIDLSLPPVLEDVTTSFDYLQPEIPLLFLPRILGAIFLFFMRHKLLVEVVIQGFRIWQLYRRYLKTVTPVLPKIIYGGEDASPLKDTVQLAQAIVFKHFITPWMAFTLILLPFAVVGTTLWLPHVKASCVDSSEGTLLARRVVVPVLVNHAMMEGNAFHTRSQISCQRENQQSCYEAFSLSEQHQLADQQASDVLAREDAYSYNSFRLIQDCVATESLDNEFRQACCGFDGYAKVCSTSNTNSCPIDNRTMPALPFQPVSSYLKNGTCGSGMAEIDLHDGRFECSKLESVCSESPCIGVNVPLLKRTIISSECHMEVYLMKACLSVLVAIYHAVMLNLCCTLIFCGIKHLWWRKLSPDGLQLRTQMNEKGELVQGTHAEERSERIAVAMARFEAMGRLQCRLGGGLFFCWFASFFILRSILSKFR